MKHRETQKHRESKHRVRIREADRRWDGSGERVEVEITSTIRKERRVSAIMKKPGNIRTNEQNTEISSIQPKTIQNRNPAIFTKHGELSNYRVWRFGTPSNDGLDPVKLLFESELQRQRNSNRTKTNDNKTKSHKPSECANMPSLQVVQIWKVECRDRSSNS
jgi:hypothetical protein